MKSIMACAVVIKFVAVQQTQFDSSVHISNVLFEKLHRSDLHVELFRYEIARGLSVWHLVSLTSLAMGQMRRLQQGMRSVRSCLTPPHLLSLQSYTRAASRERGFRDCWNIGGDPPGFVMRERRPSAAPRALDDRSGIFSKGFLER